MLFLVSNISIVSIFVVKNMKPSYLYVDRKNNGNILISTFSFQDVLNYPNRMLNQIIIKILTLPKKT